MSGSVAVPTKPFRVLTQTGRNFILDAIDSDTLLRDLGMKYGTVSIKPLTQSELEQFGYITKTDIEGAYPAA